MRTSSNIKTYRQTFAWAATCVAMTGWLLFFIFCACLVSPQFSGDLERGAGDLVELASR